MHDALKRRTGPALLVGTTAHSDRVSSHLPGSLRGPPQGMFTAQTTKTRMIPVKFDSTPGRPQPVTLVLIGLCVAAFVSRPYVPWYGSGFVPVDFVHALLHPRQELGQATLSLLLSFFTHAGLVHLVFNMWFLWVFGCALEHSLGSIRFALLYLACGVLSMVIQAASTPLSRIPVVGASGAIAGVMGACVILLPLARIILWLPPLFRFRVPAIAFLLLWFVYQYVSMRSAAPDSVGIAWWAHIGGFACGFLIAAELRRRGWHRGNGSRQRANRPRSAET